MQQLLKKIYDNKKLTKALKITSHGCVVIHIAAYMYLLYTAARNSYKELIGAAFITFLPFLIVSLMRAKIKTSRPYEIYSFYEIKPKDREGGSFPSRHVFSAFAVATLAAVYSVPLSVCLYIVGLCMWACRVLLGIHFFRDCLCGAIIGVVSVLIGIFIFYYM